MPPPLTPRRTSHAKRSRGSSSGRLRPRRGEVSADDTNMMDATLSPVPRKRARYATPSHKDASSHRQQHQQHHHQAAAASAGCSQLSKNASLAPPSSSSRHHHHQPPTRTPFRILHTNLNNSNMSSASKQSHHAVDYMVVSPAPGRFVFQRKDGTVIEPTTKTPLNSRVTYHDFLKPSPFTKATFYKESPDRITVSDAPGVVLSPPLNERPSAKKSTRRQQDTIERRVQPPRSVKKSKPPTQLPVPIAGRQLFRDEIDNISPEFEQEYPSNDVCDMELTSCKKQYSQQRDNGQQTYNGLSPSPVHRDPSAYDMELSTVRRTAVPVIDATPRSQSALQKPAVGDLFGSSRSNHIAQVLATPIASQSHMNFFSINSAHTQRSHSHNTHMQAATPRFTRRSATFNGPLSSAAAQSGSSFAQPAPHPATNLSAHPSLSRPTMAMTTRRAAAAAAKLSNTAGRPQDVNDLGFSTALSA